MVFHKLIPGSQFSDERGELNFFNSFDMSEIVRFYEISPASTNTIRGWQAHKREKKWFYCNSGGFIVNLIKIDNFEAPSSGLEPLRYDLKATRPAILEISGGFATGFKATEEHSKLLVFSDFSLEESQDDDFRFALDYWSASWNNDKNPNKLR